MRTTAESGRAAVASPTPNTRESTREDEVQNAPMERRSEDVRGHGNPAAPHRPGDLKQCDLTALEDKLIGVLYATDDWVDPYWGENTKPCENSTLDRRQQKEGKRWGEKAHRQTPPHMQPFLKHSSYTPPKGAYGRRSFPTRPCDSGGGRVE